MVSHKNFRLNKYLIKCIISPLSSLPCSQSLLLSHHPEDKMKTSFFLASFHNSVLESHLPSSHKSLHLCSLPKLSFSCHPSFKLSSSPNKTHTAVTSAPPDASMVARVITLEVTSDCDPTAFKVNSNPQQKNPFLTDWPTPPACLLPLYTLQGASY